VDVDEPHCIYETELLRFLQVGFEEMRAFLFRLFGCGGLVFAAVFEGVG
jgi:hypothetical protein